jgi:hypothetical protein
VPQLVDVQQALARVSEFYDSSIKLTEWQLFLVLVGVWLLTCALVARRGRHLKQTRYQVAQALNSGASLYGKYSSPAAVVLTVLASFTFLTNVSSALGTRLELKAVASTEDYRFAAKRIEADLGSQVVSQLYQQLRSDMPADYRQALADTSDPVSDALGNVQSTASSLIAPLAQSDPAAARRLSDEENAAKHADGAPLDSLIDAPRGNDPVDIPHELGMTPDQADAAKSRAESDSDDNRDEIVNDGRHEVLIQIEKVASEPAWNSLKDLVARWFPLEAPLVDALAEACDEHLQETLSEKVPGLVEQMSDAAVDMRAAIASTAKSIVAKVDVRALAQNYLAAASKLVTAQLARVSYLNSLDKHLQLRSDTFENIIDADSQDDFENQIADISRMSDHKLQTEVVDDLRVAMLNGLDDDPGGIGRHNAAIAIHMLGSDGVSAVTDEDIEHALPLCGCRG